MRNQPTAIESEYCATGLRPLPKGTPMRIVELYRRNGPVFSFEFFPPKTDAGVPHLMRTLDELKQLDPDFVSVTYPLDRSRRHVTLDLVARIKRELGIETMAHLTASHSTTSELEEALRRLDADGIENVLALRGDFPAEGEAEIPRGASFLYAAEFVAFIRERFRFCIGGAAHPEKHPDAVDPESDLLYLKEKVRAGCEFLITQFFFRNDDYFRFVDRIGAIGIDVPIVPGIMPVTSVRGIKRMASMNDSRLPDELLRQLEGVEDDSRAVEEVGTAWAQAQSEGLLAGGVPGIHFYTLNRSRATRRILEALRG